MGRHELELETKVRAPRQKVWDVLTDPKGYPKWMLHVHEVELKSKTFKQGSRLRLVSRTTNHVLSSDVEVTEFVPEERLAWRSVEELMDGQPFEHVSDIETEFELSGDGKTTVVRVYGGFLAKSLRAKLGAGLLLRTRVRPELERALDELRRLCE
jgi:uncharacterized protein YndB with AHSA1/START domain